jgi:hypothetical protein
MEATKVNQKCMRTQQEIQEEIEESQIMCEQKTEQNDAHNVMNNHDRCIISFECNKEFGGGDCAELKHNAIEPFVHELVF